jgi:hypothetical protein
MKKTLSNAQAAYCPQMYKTFEGALESFFARECPQIGGELSRQVLVKSVSDMVSKFYPETSHLRQGQTLWCTVDRRERSSYGKSIRNTELRPVVLDLVRTDDIKERAAGKKLRDIKKEAVVRLCEQAYRQDGCLSGAELAILLKVSMPTISKYIKEWEIEHNRVVPRRGSIHDIGPTLTHKKIIINKLFIEHESVQQTSRETYHSPQAIQRYISMFRQVMLCCQKGMNTEEIAFATGRTKRLVREYEQIIEEYGRNNYNIKQLIDKEPYIENDIELWMAEYANE